METKRCSGHNGHWECADKYPDHIVPVVEFGPDGDGLQGKCRKCNDYRNGVISKVEAYAKKEGLVADQKGWRALSKEERDGIKAKFNKSEGSTEHGANVLPMFKRDEPLGKPMRTREPSEMKGELVPQGWVYVVSNPDIPHIIKIGKTYPDGIGSIMSSARRFGRATLLEKHYFDEALKAETAIHALLSKWNMRNLGYEDCGKELFKCSVNCFRKALREYQQELENVDEVG